MAATPPHGWNTNNMMNGQRMGQNTHSFSDMHDPRQQSQQQQHQVRQAPTLLRGHRFPCGWQAAWSNTHQKYYFVDLKTTNPSAASTFNMPDVLNEEMTGSHWIQYLGLDKEFPALAVQNPQAGNFAHFNWDKFGKILMRLRATPNLQEV